MVSADEVKMLHAIEKLLKFSLPRKIIEGFEPTQELKIASSKPKSCRRKKPDKKRPFYSSKKKNWGNKSQQKKSKKRKKNKNSSNN